MKRLSPLQEASSLPFGRLAAFLHCCGGPNVLDDVLRGDAIVTVTRDTRERFDENGRFALTTTEDATPAKGWKRILKGEGSELWFPERVSYRQRYAHIAAPLSRWQTPSWTTIVGVGSFHTRALALVAEVGKLPRFGNLFKGPTLPIIIPQFNDDDRLYEEVLPMLVSAGIAFPTVDEGSDRDTRWRWKNFRTNLVPHSASRQWEFLARVRREPLVGLFFPNAFAGYSAAAAQEVVQGLPNGFVLGGAVDTCIAIAMYPDLLWARGGHLLWSGMSLQGNFGQTPYLDHGLRGLFSSKPVPNSFETAIATCNFSTGLLFIGT